MATRETSSSSPLSAIKGQTQQSLEEALRTQRSETLRKVSASSKLLEECIFARERLDSANSRIRALRSRPPLLEDGEASEEATAVSSAIPVAQEFSTKMAELAMVAPGLSALLVSATERLGGATHGTTGPSASGPADGGQGTERPRTPPADDVHEVLKIVLPALAQLLSFDHLRASTPVARNLVQALVNLYRLVGNASPGEGDGESQASHGSGRSSTEGTPSSSHKSASPLASSSGGAGSGGGKSVQSQRDRLAKKTASWVTNILTQAFAPKVYGGATVRSSGLDALLGENGVDSLHHHQAVQAELLHNTQVLQSFAEEELASRRSRRRESGGGNREDPLERLFETTLEAFGSMLQLGGDDDGEPPAMKVLLARLQEDSYRMLAGRETDRETGAGELKGPCLAYLEDPPLLQYQQARIDQQAALSSLSSVSNPSMAATFPVGTPRKHLLPGSSPHSLQKRRPYPGTFLGPFPAPHPPPREWEGRVRDCLAELKHRPFICPDEMLRSTGAVPSLAPEAYTRDDVRRRAPNGEYQHMDGFRLSQVCLLLALDLIEEAVLKEGGGEAEAGLLRALRTPRVSGVEAKAGVRLTLGGQARGRMDGAELSALVGLLEERPSGCPDNGLAALAWALQDIGQRYGFSELPCDNTSGLSFRPFEVELWLLLVGYRHWIMVAMVQLLSAGRCDACRKVKPPMKRNISKKIPESAMRKAETRQGDVSELAEKTPAHWLLAWYACGGYTKPASLLEEAVEAMMQAATCLDDFESARDGEGLVVEKALDSAGKSGKGLVREALMPFTAVAWLLTSRAALVDCERVLAHSVLRSEDLETVLEERTSNDSLWRSGKEAILQGLAALEDMVWLAGLRPPLDHIHAGRDLRNLLERVRVWLGEVGGRCRKRDEGGKATSTTVPDKDAVSADYSDLLFDDFSKRRDGICRSLGSLLAAALPQSR